MLSVLSRKRQKPLKGEDKRREMACFERDGDQQTRTAYEVTEREFLRGGFLSLFCRCVLIDRGDQENRREKESKEGQGTKSSSQLWH